jgi:hypothetical protein
MPRPSRTAATMLAKLSSVRIMSVASRVTSVPVLPIATPMCASRSATRFRSLRYLELTHHPVLGVLEDVTVKHPSAGMLFELNPEARGRFRANVDGVLPGAIAGRNAVIGRHLESKAMEMERVIHLGGIDDFPFLHGAEIALKVLGIRIDVAID